METSKVEWWVALKAWQLAALMVVCEAVVKVYLWVAMTVDEKVVHSVAQWGVQVVATWAVG